MNLGINRKRYVILMFLAGIALSSSFAAHAMESAFSRPKISGDLAAKLGLQFIDAAREGDLQELERLIDCGADVNVKDDSTTALMCAATHGYDDVVKYLIELGADLNAVDKHGWTALMWATVISNKLVCELLVEAMLQITDVQKKRIYSFLFCLKKGSCSAEYPHLKNVFRPYFYQIMKEENKKIAFTEVNKIKNNQIQKYLLDKYGLKADEDNNSWCVIL